MSRHLLRALILSLALLACSSPPSDESATGALRLFFESIAAAQASAGTTRLEALENAYDLLDEESRERLAARARTAGALGGRDHQPCEMLAAYPSRGMSVPTRAANFREVLEDATHATVTVRLDDGRSVDVAMVHEEGWRVVLGVPELVAE